MKMKKEMNMNKQMKALTLALGTTMVLASGSVMAEAQYGYSTTAAGVTAQAKVNLSVVVPKLILLRVGSDNTTIDTLAWTSAPSFVTAPTPLVAANNQQVPWTGAAPTITVTSAPSPAALTVSAWTNAATPTINCAMGTWTGPASGGPANADFTVAATGASVLPHPGANLGACASTTFVRNTLYTGTWTYSLAGTPTSWQAGTYTNTVTYTAAGV